eukprot:277189_1
MELGINPRNNTPLQTAAHAECFVESVCPIFFQSIVLILKIKVSTALFLPLFSLHFFNFLIFAIERRFVASTQQSIFPALLPPPFLLHHLLWAGAIAIVSI